MLKFIFLGSRAISNLLQQTYTLCALLLASAVYSSPTSYIWLEEPMETNLPNKARWDNLSNKEAPAVIQKTKVESIYAKYEIDVAEGGIFQLWGRTYAPDWSSPGRWRIDQGDWQEWTPGGAVDKQVANGTYVMVWCHWGQIELATGKHTLQFEVTGNRKATGDMPFFVLDNLLLVKGDFKPSGMNSPSVLIDQNVAITQEKLQLLGEDIFGYQEQAKEILDVANGYDLAVGLQQFRILHESMERSLETKALVEKNNSKRLSGRVESAVVDGRSLEIKMQWSDAFDAKLWLGILKDEALYYSTTMDVSREWDQSIHIELPEGLPAGKLTLECLPIAGKVAKSARADFQSPSDSNTRTLKPASWGIYRDDELRVHPWNVTAGGMMMWDGEPFIPVGGMFNTKLSWTTKAGDRRINRSDILEEQLKLLKSHGLTDIYFNGFFANGNPASMAVAVGLAEKYGMHYGLHITSTPDAGLRSPGFVQSDRLGRFEPIELEVGVKSADVLIQLMPDECVAGARCVWVVLTQSGKVLSSGVAIPDVEIVEPPTVSADVKGRQLRRMIPKLTRQLTFRAEFESPLTERAQMVLIPEMTMPRNDPSGYMDGIGTYHKMLEELYGSLALGSGMRMWVDPFLNELHARNTFVSSSDTFLDQYASYLLHKYTDISELNKAWMPSGNPVSDFLTASRLIPVKFFDDKLFWIDPKTQQVYSFSAEPAETLHDLTAFKGSVAEEMISQTADVLKGIANVPVVLKHNTFFSDWFVNPRKTGGQDGLGFESYCYGDSLAYHNSLVPLAEARASARHQWTIETETSPAAFDGQKDYVGYLDRLQMLHDFDLMAMFGAKGIYTFGFAFDPAHNFQITELIRDPRQLEWMSTYAKTVRAASDKLSVYTPEVYGWYPVSLREKELTGDTLDRFEMDGQYIGTTGQIRMAPDGRWIIPAYNTEMGLEGYLTAWDFLSKTQQNGLVDSDSEETVWLLGDEVNSDIPEDWSVAPLNSFTASGIGVIPQENKGMTLDDFRRDVLGYRVFQTESINGCTLTDGSLLIWTCVEKESATVRLPVSAKLKNIQGEPIQLAAVAGSVGQVTLVQSSSEKLKGDLPVYLQHMPTGYYYNESPQTEVAIVTGVSVDEFLNLNPAAWQRWLPETVVPEAVSAWIEAEDSSSTTFVQPRVEGYSRYSGSAAIGMNTHWDAPAGEQYSADYKVNASSPFSKIWIRRMDQPAMDVQILIDGKLVGEVPAKVEMSDLMHLNPWNAGLATNNMQVGWIEVSLPHTFKSGNHTIQLIADGGEDFDRKVDLALLGGQSDKAMEDEAAKEGSKLKGLQIDVLMLTK